MTNRLFLWALLAFLSIGVAGQAVAADDIGDRGMARVKSAYTVAETVERGEAALTERGMVLFGRFDHAQAADGVGLNLPPTVVIIFGNPRAGTPAMAKEPLSAIDFPLKALVYQDASGDVWFAYNTAEYVFGTIFERHHLKAPAEAPDRYRALMQAVASAATQ
jgi:uncharacterized protein (DUF302 family)